MTTIETARRWVLSKRGDGLKEIRLWFTPEDLPAGVSIAVLDVAVTMLEAEGSIGEGSGAIRSDNAGYMLRLTRPQSAL